MIETEFDGFISGGVSYQPPLAARRMDPDEAIAAVVNKEIQRSSVRSGLYTPKPLVGVAPPKRVWAVPPEVIVPEPSEAGSPVAEIMTLSRTHLPQRLQILMAGRCRDWL